MSEVANTIHPIDIETGKLMSGPYEGEVLGVCGSESQTTRMPNVELTRDEAAAFRDRFSLTPERFHLDIDDNREGMSGTYCIYYENPALIRDYIDRMDCSLFGESALEVMARKLPFVESSRCEKVLDSLHRIGGVPTLWEKQEGAASFVLWMSVGGAALNSVMGAATGKSILQRIFGKGKGPDDKNDPPSSGGGMWRGGPFIDAEWTDKHGDAKDAIGSLPVEKSAEVAAEAGLLTLMGVGLFHLAKYAAASLVGPYAAALSLVPAPALDRALGEERVEDKFQ